MLAMTGAARYADLMERTLYNGFLAHVSLDGGKFHYLCPLSSDGNHWQRTPWASASTSCCSPNALRMIASLPGYIFSTSHDGVWVHLYDNCAMNWRLADGTKLRLAQATAYPWSGHITIKLDPERPSTFDLEREDSCMVSQPKCAGEWPGYRRRYCARYLLPHQQNVAQRRCRHAAAADACCRHDRRPACRVL